MTVVKIIGVGIISVCLIVSLRSIIPALTPLIAGACGVIILGMCISEMKGFVGYYYELCVNSEYSEYFTVMLKGLGVALLTQIGSDFCRDSGETLIASRIEFAGKVEILLIALPLVKSLVSLSESILLK